METLVRTIRRLRDRSSGFGEAGMTLPELLIALVITGMIVGVIGTAITTALRTTGPSSDRLDQSHDAEALSLWFPADVAGAFGSAFDIAAGSPTGCSGVAPGSNVIRFQSMNAAGSTTYASYRVAQTGTKWQLLRFACDAGGTATQFQVVDNLLNDLSASPTIAGDTVRLRVVTSTLTEQYTFEVSGTRRTSGAGPTAPPTSGVPTTPPTTSTSTTSSTTTSSTTTTSTTTTTLPCSYVASSGRSIPATVSRQGSSANLSDSFTFEVKTAGACSAVSVQFTPGANTPATVTVALEPNPAGTTWTATVGKNTFRWNSGTKTIQVNTTPAITPAPTFTMVVS